MANYNIDCAVSNMSATYRKLVARNREDKAKTEFFNFLFTIISILLKAKSQEANIPGQLSQLKRFDYFSKKNIILKNFF